MRVPELEKFGLKTSSPKIYNYENVMVSSFLNIYYFTDH